MPARMRRNLDLTGGLIVAEAVMMALAEHTGRGAAHDLVYGACRAPLDKGGTLLPELMRRARDREASRQPAASPSWSIRSTISASPAPWSTGCCSADSRAPYAPGMARALRPRA